MDAPVVVEAPCEIVRLDARGFSRVKLAVVDDVMPRPLPGCLSDAEVDEVERRLWTLGLFDDVKVEKKGAVLSITVREKWTLVPGVDFGTAKTLRDSYLFLSLTEGNVAGRAVECGGYGAYYERAFSGELWCGEHLQAARRITFEAAAHYVGSGFVYDDTPYLWERRRSGGRIGVRLPFFHGTHWRFAFLPAVYHERSTGDVPQGLVERGTFIGLSARATWDRYEWNDLAPSGVRYGIELTPGTFVHGDATRGRHSFVTQMLAALRISSQAALLINLVAEGANAGDPNHTVLLGSISGWRGSFGVIGGVRGLPDNRNRNAAHAFGNVELRGALKLAERWFLQGALFVDGGAYARVDPFGDVHRAEPALGVGGGVRIVPTFLAWMVPRVDAGTLLAPQRAWFVQFGLSQYF